MADGANVAIRLHGSMVLNAGLGRAVVRFGAGNIPDALFRLFPGDKSGQADDLVAVPFSVAKEATFAYDLAGATDEENILGVPVDWGAVKMVGVVVDDPATGKKLWFGPQGAEDAAPLWFPDATADSKQEVHDMLFVGSRADGWAIETDATKIVISNPATTGDPVTGWMILAGVQA